MNFKAILNVLGALLVLVGLTMVVPIGLALGNQEPDLLGFIKAMVASIGIGLPVWFFTRNNRILSNKDGFAIVTLAWTLTALVGALPFYLSGAIPNFTDAFFESMSGVTTTGASILGNSDTMPHLAAGIESLSSSILYWRSFIQWIGGMGIIVFTIAILPLLGIGGVQLFKAEVPGPVADKIRPRVRETAKILWMVYVGFTVVEILLLGISGMSWFDAICHAFTTMPTGGFSTKNASIAFFPSPVIQYILILFMFIAGINFSLHFRLLTGDKKAFFKDPEFLVYLGVIVGVTLFITINLCSAKGVWNHETFRSSLFQSVSILTTTGYVSADYEIWPFFTQFLLLILMFIGGMGGSTGGGMKIIRVLLLVKYAATETRRMLHARAIIPIRIGNRYISEDVVRNTLGFFLFYLTIFAIATLILTTLNLDLGSAIGAAASALGNVGPALGNFGPTDNYALLHPIGKWLLTVLMLLGRLEIFTVIVMFSRTFWK
jgi:trk system potassium uptake protein TrkH